MDEEGFADVFCATGAVLELLLELPSEYTIHCSNVGTITGVEAIDMELLPLKLDESEPDPFESTPIRRASSIRY